jgi:hypothetical protein
MSNGYLKIEGEFLQLNHAQMLFLFVNHALRKKGLYQLVDELIRFVAFVFLTLKVKANIACSLMSELERVLALL